MADTTSGSGTAYLFEDPSSPRVVVGFTLLSL